MLMRKRAALCVSWSYQFYLPTRRKSTELLLLGSQLPESAAKSVACNLQSRSFRRYPLSVLPVGRAQTSQDLRTSVVSGLQEDVLTKTSGSSELCSSNCFGFFPRQVQGLLRQTFCKRYVPERPAARASHGNAADCEERNMQLADGAALGQTNACNGYPLVNKKVTLVSDSMTLGEWELEETGSTKPCNTYKEPLSWDHSPQPAGLGPCGSFYFSSKLRIPRVNGRISKLCSSQIDSRSYSSVAAPPTKGDNKVEESLASKYSQRAVVTALWCNFLVFSLKLGVWGMTSSHVMLAEAIHSLADLANQGLLAYGLMSSKRAPDALHPYGYTKEKFVWSLISAVGIFCLGSGATIIHGLQNLFKAQPLENVYLAALVLGGSAIMEGASLLVAINCVQKGAQAEGMTIRDYLWRGHDPTTAAVMMEDGAAVTGLVIAALALAAVHYTGNPIWDPIGSIVVGNLLGAVAIFLIQRNRHALLGRSMDDKDMMLVIGLLAKDPVVDAIYDCKSEVIGPGAYRFKAEIDFDGVVIVQNYLRRTGRDNWQKEFAGAVSSLDPAELDKVMASYGEEIVSALGSEVDRLEKEIQKLVPGIRHVDIEAHNPKGPAPREKFYVY